MANQWECFSDSSYYDFWCVRIIGQRKFGEGFHVCSGEEAKALRDLLTSMSNKIEELEKKLEDKNA